MANIRGGGEFGPAWHQAALKGKRQSAYDDFIAVAEDLVAKGITSPERLGIRGGSNGGLLMGNMTVQVIASPFPLSFCPSPPLPSPRAIDLHRNHALCPCMHA